MGKSKSIFSAAVAMSAVLGISAASAADLHVKAAPIAVPVLNWTGCYVGGNAGWIGADNRYSLAPSGSNRAGRGIPAKRGGHRRLSGRYRGVES